MGLKENCNLLCGEPKCKGEKMYKFMIRREKV